MVDRTEKRKKAKVNRRLVKMGELGKDLTLGKAIRLVSEAAAKEAEVDDDRGLVIIPKPVAMMLVELLWRVEDLERKEK